MPPTRSLAWRAATGSLGGDLVPAANVLNGGFGRFSDPQGVIGPLERPIEDADPGGGQQRPL